MKKYLSIFLSALLLSSSYVIAEEIKDGKVAEEKSVDDEETKKDNTAALEIAE